MFFKPKCENKDTAVIYREKPYSFDTLLKMSERLRKLFEQHLRPEDPRVGVLLNNTPLFCSTVIAVDKLSVGCVLFSTKYKISEINEYIRLTQPAMLIESGLHEIDFVEYDKEQIYSEVNDDFGTIKIWKITYEEDNQIVKDFNADTKYFTYQFTSGTQGTSKVVPRTYENVYHEVLNYTETVKISKSDVVICPSPLFHAYGFINGFLVPFYNGATTILTDTFVPGEFIGYIKKYKATICICVPYMYHLLNEAYVSSPDDISSLRICFSAGAKLDNEIAKRFLQKYNLDINQQYGSTETGTIAVNLQEDSKPIDICSVGTALKTTEIRIVDDKGNILKNGEEGEIIIKSDGTTKDYLTEDSSINKKFKEGWYYTHDVGKIDSKNRLYITGRRSSFINIAGLKVDPFEVESIMQTMRQIKECVVVGIPDQKCGEKIVGFVVAETSATADEIFTFCKMYLANYKVPGEIVFLDELPKSPTGKILRKYLINNTIKHGIET